MKFQFALVSFFLLTHLNPALGAQSLSTKITTPYSSFRALGMGNAFTAVADDYSLMFYNPAGFANKKNNEVQFTFAGAGLSNKLQTMVNDLKTASDKEGTDQEKAEAISEVLEQYYGKAMGGKVQALEMFWIRKNWGIALIPVDLTVDMSIDRQLGPAIDLNIKGDTTLAYGYGTEVAKNWSVGATAKYVHRVSVEQSVSALELASDSDILSSKRFKEGNAFDLDIGVLWTPDWFNSAAVSPVLETKEVEIEIPDEPELTPNAVSVPVSSSPPAEAGAILPETNPSVPANNPINNPIPKIENEPARQVQSEIIPDTAAPPAAASVATSAAVPTVVETAPPTTVEVGKPALPKMTNPPDSNLGKKNAKKSKKDSVKKAIAVEKVKSYYPLTFGAVVHNVLGGSFSKSNWVNKDATEAPSKMERVIDIGSQYKLFENDSLTVRTMVDFKNLLHPEANTFNKVFHAGLEFDYSPSGWFKAQLRGGVNQMYYTAGATLLLGVLNIDFVTYGDEVGTATNKLESRVYAAKLGLNF